MPQHKSDDPKRNAGISLTAAEISKLDDYKKEAKLDSRSAVVDLLLQRGMPLLWADLLLEESQSSNSNG